MRFLAENFCQKRSFSFFFCTFEFPHTFDQADNRKSWINMIFTPKNKKRSDKGRERERTWWHVPRMRNLLRNAQSGIMSVVSVRFSGDINSILHLAIRATRPRKPLCNGQFSTDDTQPRRVGRVLLRQKSAKYRSHYRRHI